MKRGAARVTRARAASAVVWLACASAGCADDDERPPPLRDFGDAQPIAGCEGFSYEPCDISEGGCQSELFELVRCVAGDPPAAAVLPPISLLSREDAYARLLGTDAGDTSASFSDSVRALEGLGLLEPGVASDEQALALASLEGVVGVYLDDSKEIILLDDGEPVAGLGANMVLAHEMVHALQDQKHDLAGLRGRAPQTFDGLLALAGLIEGEATLYELLLTYAYEGIGIGNADFSRIPSVADELIVEIGSPALLARNLFPYTYGAAFAGAIWRGGGAQALDSAYAGPPADTLAIVSENGALRSSPPEPIAPLAGYSLLEEDEFGAWVAAATAAASLLVDPDGFEQAELARAWRGDRYAVYRSDDGAGTLVAEWTVRWSDASAAERFASYYAEWVPPWGQLSVRAAADTTHVVLAERLADADAWLRR